MQNSTSTLKEFGPAGYNVRETVARTPSLDRHGLPYGWKPDIFCLRIDADEYSPESFNPYYSVFEQYWEAITIFFNINSFKDAKDQILRCRDLGVDIQSHAFYHHTYNDYASNRYNISKAKTFFQEIGIKTTGFAAPLGRWNASFMKALEDEGYKYSSDFSYDYMGFPSFPFEHGKFSTIMQIPIFPVAPEPFFQDRCSNPEAVEKYYKNAIDEMIGCNLPVIIYAHTNPTTPEVMPLLLKIVDYAVNCQGLRPISMTDFSEMWGGVMAAGNEGGQKAEPSGTPGEEFLGKAVVQGIPERVKGFLKNKLDFERVTPAEDLKCSISKRVLKTLARKVLQGN